MQQPLENLPPPIGKSSRWRSLALNAPGRSKPGATTPFWLLSCGRSGAVARR